MLPSIDLNVDAPDKVPKVLREAAQAYCEATTDLQAAWGDQNAGAIWTKYAKILERAADSCQREWDKVK